MLIANRTSNHLIAAILLAVLTVGNAAAISLDALSNSDATAGIKAALEKGSAAAIASLGRKDGFLANPKVHIPLPESLQKAKSAMKLLGKGQQMDELEVSINHAAEQAVPEARELVTQAVRNMSVDDAKNIVRGGDDSVTQFFKSKTSAQLAERFLPIVKRVTDRNGLAQQYNSLAGQGVKLGVIKADQASVERYVTQRALDGLYTMIGEEERKIRKDPVGAGSELIKKVFSATR